jgi:hypothetical protein
MECARHPARTFPLLTAWLPILLERSPNRFPVLRGGFHYHFLHLLLDKPFPPQLQRCNCSGLLPYQRRSNWYSSSTSTVSYNHGQLLFMDINSRCPIRHKLLLAGAESVPKITLSRVSGYRRSHRGETTLIYSLYHARSESDRRSVSVSPLITQSRHSQPFWIIVKL